jgi:hypothetical protein
VHSCGLKPSGDSWNVMVLQRPCGTLAGSRERRYPQPRSGAMLVLVQVSSMKTRRTGSIPLWCAVDCARRRATSGRSCALASTDFFVKLSFSA